MSALFKEKIQKISVNGGFTCPNRDGTIGVGGCTYCNNQSFSPPYCQGDKSIRLQLEEGIRFFSKKYPTMKYLAYFQQYTNTYGRFDELVHKYEEALSVDHVVGLVIGTRPDCVSEQLLDYLSDLSQKTFVLVEFGIETPNDKILKRINRGHTFQQAERAITRTAARGIRVGGHLILGLPGESQEELVSEAYVISSLPLSLVKLHQLQLIKGTRMAQEYDMHPEDFPMVFDNVDDYVDLVVEYVERLRSTLVVERFVSQSPNELVVAPRWGIKNHEIVSKVKKHMAERRTWQGRLCDPVYNKV